MASRNDLVEELSLDPKREVALIDKCALGLFFFSFLAPSLTAFRESMCVCTGAAMCASHGITARDLNLRWRKYSYENSNADMNLAELVRSIARLHCFSILVAILFGQSAKATIRNLFFSTTGET